ncbi:protein translocase subunit SecD [Silvibacterium dinghuense]|uniref:Protein translocase subunit SecD n=1 Tax=Silvibacterium dinghuense TaxID=1560006 RepID=A0A4V1NW23_9BACT|nr:protein translocase subunit SecD [Silvibacterium dinghuense]RXS97922.1 protein translocase subunit SecD [Silvibacterium dinghuense]GGH03030.1 protein translocase subunit SecD [Silvibacterium dinghuense]
MRKNLTNKVILIIAVLLVFVFGIIGVPKGLSGAALKDALLQRISLGLDLRGGTHLILQVMVDEAVGITRDSDASHIQTDLQQAGITVGSVAPDTSRTDVINISGVPADHTSDVRSTIDSKYGTEYDIASGANNTFTLTMKPSVVDALKKSAMDQSIQVITQRVNELGTSEPVIQEYNLGSNQILVELPGVDDLSRVKEVIQSTARLEIHAVDGGPYSSEQDALQQLGGTVPVDELLLPTKPGASSSGSIEWYELKRVAEVGGTDIRSARVSQNPNTNAPEVDFYLTTAAGDHFADYTGANKGKSLAVTMDNKVQEVAVIHDQIRDQGNIGGGNMTNETANDLAMLLNTGSLPASLHYLQESTVGPSLGADSIHQGVMASIVGMLAVMIFMLIYYRGAGINADLALFLNLVILLGFMGYTHSVLTLPGIAGVILTIGMGVDSNVLIFERIREEIRAGKSPSASVEQGFGHAWTTILDTHVTTIVSAIILFIFGTGPVRGFAVTLSFGLFANLFTAVFVSRTIFDANLNRKGRGEAISI